MSQTIRDGEAKTLCRSFLPSVSGSPRGEPVIQFDRSTPAPVVTRSPTPPPRLIGDLVFAIVERLAVARLERAAEKLRSE